MTTIRVRCTDCGAHYPLARIDHAACRTCGTATWTLVPPTAGDWAAAHAELVDAAGVVSETLTRGRAVRPQSEGGIRLQAAWRTLALLRKGVLAR
jgi:hypothetical protein